MLLRWDSTLWSWLSVPEVRLFSAAMHSAYELVLPKLVSLFQVTESTAHLYRIRLDMDMIILHYA